MSTDTDLRRRVVELEDRVEELEQLLGDDDVDETQSTDFEPVDQLHPKTVIEDIPGAHSDGVTVETVLQRLEEHGFDDPDEEIDKLRRRGEIYNPTNGLVKVV